MIPALGSISIQVLQEAAEIFLAVLRPRAGRAVAYVPGGRTGPPECLDLVFRTGSEPDVHAVRRGLVGLGRRDAEIVPLGELLPGAGRSAADRSQDRLIEGAAGRQVGYTQRDVVEH